MTSHLSISSLNLQPKSYHTYFIPCVFKVLWKKDIYFMASRTNTTFSLKHTANSTKPVTVVVKGKRIIHNYIRLQDSKMITMSSVKLPDITLWYGNLKPEIFFP